MQHRYSANGSVVKVNHLHSDLPDLPPCGYRGLAIARTAALNPVLSPDAWLASHPGGDAVTVVDPATNPIEGIAITVSSLAPESLIDFYVEVMQFARVDRRTVRCGDSLVNVVAGPGGSATSDCIGTGFRYLTVQVFDADAECEGIARRGGRIARAPVSFRDVARFGFAADPDGNWIEMSARASLTGISP